MLPYNAPRKMFSHSTSMHTMVTQKTCILRRVSSIIRYAPNVKHPLNQF